jgi:hypothetical protein
MRDEGCESEDVFSRRSTNIKNNVNKEPRQQIVNGVLLMVVPGTGLEPAHPCEY